MNAHPCYVGGEWRETGHTLRVHCPFDDRVVGEAHLAGAAEFDMALAAARAAFPRMRALPAHRREAALHAIAEAIHADAEEFARTITLEMGKTIRESRLEVSRAVETFRVSAAEARRLGGEILDLGASPGHEGRLALVRRFPRGVVLGITPFNFPLNLVAHKVGPALAAGAPILVKPASKTPLTALRLARAVDRAGFPPGAMSVLPAPGAEAGRAAADPRVAVVTFTGSAEIGWALRERAARKQVALELGGNAAAIVEPDTDLEYAARRLAAGSFAIAGQSCISVQRIFAARAIYEDLLARLVAAARALRAGDPLAEETDLGPLVDEANAARVAAWVEEAVKEGARVECGGGRRGTMVEATVLSGVKGSARVSCEEVFGPVVTVTPYDRFEEALGAVNDSRFGLQAGVFTGDLAKAHLAHRELEVGGVVIGDVPSYRADAMPYGGEKESGTGREGPRWAIEEMTSPRVLVLNAG